MVRYGFVRSEEEVKFLTLYCMKYLDIPVSFDAIIDLCTWCDDGFSYFDLVEAFNGMLNTGHIVKVDDKNYEISQRGREVSDLFEDRLAYTVREAAQKSAVRVVRQIKRNASIITERIENGPNDYVARLSMQGVFALDMNVVNKSQANMIERNFQKNAEKIYAVILNCIISEQIEKEDKK